MMLERYGPIERAVIETGRMSPAICLGLRELGVPVVCIDARQAHQSLKAMKANKTDPHDAAGLAQLAERIPELQPYRPQTAVAEFQRDLIRESAVHGLAAAHARGAASGKPKAARRDGHAGGAPLHGAEGVWRGRDRQAAERFAQHADPKS